MKRPISLLGAGLAALVSGTIAAAAEQPSAQGARIQFVIAGEVLSATLVDNSASRDFLTRLPLEVELTDYANIEKIFYPKPKLSTADVPDGMAADAGDITYYAPWGDVAIFHRSSEYASGLVPLGRFEDPRAIAVLSQKGPIAARIEPAR